VAVHSSRDRVKVGSGVLRVGLWSAPKPMQNGIAGISAGRQSLRIAGACMCDFPGMTILGLPWNDGAFKLPRQAELASENENGNRRGCR